MDASRQSNERLTTDVEGTLEGCCDFGVQLEHEVILFSHVVVAVLDQVLDPVCKRRSDERVDYVDDPLPRQAMDVAGVGEVGLDLVVLLALLQDGFYVQALVHRHV